MNLYGNKIIVDYITNSISNNKVGHSYLFYGESGIGKLTSCIFFAKSLLCPNFYNNHKFPCGCCRCCKKIKSHSHPDIHIYRSSGGLNTIHVDLIRNIKSKAFTTPNESLYNIFIIENSQNMTISAFNAILKLIEEPPTHTIFMLTCENKSLIPSTILSRTINHRLLPISYEDCFSIIKKRYPNTDDKKINFYIDISERVIGKTINFLKDTDYTYEISYSFLENISKSKNLKAFNTLKKAAVNRDILLKILDTIALILNIAISYHFKDDKSKFNYDFLFKEFSCKQLFEIYDIINSAMDNLKYNCSLNLSCIFIFSQIQSIKTRRC